MAHSHLDIDHRIYQVGYLNALTGDMDKNEIYFALNNALKSILKRDIKIEINVVKNNKNIKVGHAHLWTPEEDVYYLLTGHNPDGTERYEYIDNPEYNEDEENKEDKELNDVVEWGELVEKVIEKKIKVKQKPLVKLDFIVSKSFFDPYKKNVNYENAIICTKIPIWLDNETILRRFRCYEKDKSVHIEKKTNKRFSYPIIIRKKNFGKIIFSNLNPKTANFVIEMVKKVVFKRGEKEQLLNFYVAEIKNE